MRDVWKEGKYIDLWSLTHFLGGVVYTGWMLMFGFGIWVTFISYIIIAIGFETFEVFKNIYEHPENKTMDVIFGVLGFLSAYSLIINLNPTDELFSFSIITIVLLSLEVWGFIAYNKRNKT